MAKTTCQNANTSLDMWGLSVSSLLLLFGAFQFGQTIEHGVPIKYGWHIPVNVTSNITNANNNRSVVNRYNNVHVPNPQPYNNVPVHNPPTYINVPVHNPPTYINVPVPNPPIYNNVPVQTVQNGPVAYNKNGSPVVANPNDIYFGSRVPGDQLLFSTLVVKNIGMFRSSAEKNIIYPDPSSSTHIKRITALEFKDKTKNRTGGHVQVMAGGVGNKMVDCRFKSKNGKKIDLLFNVYGFP